MKTEFKFTTLMFIISIAFSNDQSIKIDLINSLGNEMHITDNINLLPDGIAVNISDNRWMHYIEYGHDEYFFDASITYGLERKLNSKLGSVGGYITVSSLNSENYPRIHMEHDEFFYIRPELQFFSHNAIITSWFGFKYGSRIGIVHEIKHNDFSDVFIRTPLTAYISINNAQIGFYWEYIFEGSLSNWDVWNLKLIYSYSFSN